MCDHPRPPRTPTPSSAAVRWLHAVGVSALLLGAACSGSDTATADDRLARDEQSLTPRQLLGKRLFEDTNLSEPPGQACASCHDPQHAFAGNAGSPVAAVAQGSRPGQLGGRNVPTAMYTSFSPAFGFLAEPGEGPAPEVELVPNGGQFWDGRASSLVEQAKGPFLNPREMNNADARAVVGKVRGASYAELFRTVYGRAALDDADAAYGAIADAIAAFEETPRFHPFTSKFDDVLQGADQFTEEEARGFALFRDPEKGNCLACHVGAEGSRDPRDWLFTDFTYDALGIPRNALIPDNADPAHFDLGLCQQPGLAGRAPRGFDEQSVCGAFKVPTLRNVARTAPYGHNGYFAELRDVVRFYVTRDTSPERWYPAAADGMPRLFDDLPSVHHGNVNTTEVPYDRHPGEAPRLDDAEIDALVAFLNTLSDR